MKLVDVKELEKQGYVLFKRSKLPYNVTRDDEIKWAEIKPTFDYEGTLARLQILDGNYVNMHLAIDALKQGLNK